MKLSLQLLPPRCATLCITNIEDPLKVSHPDIPREAQILMEALTEKFFYIGKTTLEPEVIFIETQVFLDTVYLVNMVALIQNGGEWEPYIAVGLSSKSELCTTPGHFIGTIAKDQTKGDCLILNDYSLEGPIHHCIPLKEIEYLQIRLQS